MIRTVFALILALGLLAVPFAAEAQYRAGKVSRVIQGVNLVIVTIIVLTNLAVDLVYAVLDPRIRY